MNKTAVKVLLPTLLHHCANGQREVQVQAATLQAAIDQLIVDFPLLKTHLYDQSGQQRPHVLIFYNGENIDWLDDLHQPLHAGDTITVLQAVSGG